MSARMLFQPFTIGALKLPNRVVMAPLTRSRAGPERIPNDLMVEYYAQRSAAGLIISEATTISEQANGWINTPGIYTDSMRDGWKTVTAAVHQQGGRIFLQLWHMGRASHSSFQKKGRLPVSASPIRIENDHIHTPSGRQPYEVPRALETSEIPGIVEDYAKAATRALEAGFDGVEIHSANGYLLDQFLQSKTNKRTDLYGGSIANRARFLLEVTNAVVSVWPKYRVGIRLSPNGNYNDMGSPDFREQFTHTIKELNNFDLAYLHVMDGLGLGFHKLGKHVSLSEVRKIWDRALMGNGGYTQSEAEKVLAAGDTDLIAFGRLFIANPDLPRRLEKGLPLAPDPPSSVWYRTGPEGYADFSSFPCT